MTVTDVLTTVRRSQKNVVAGASQVVWSNLFLLGYNSFLARQLQIFIVTYLYKTKFFIH